jgi:hypothetical protein
VRHKTDRGKRGDRREVLTGVGDEGQRTDFGEVGPCVCGRLQLGAAKSPATWVSTDSVEQRKG